MFVTVNCKYVYPELTGSKIPISRIRVENENCKWGSTASKYPIGSTNIQWGMKKTPTE
ncbi:hypothetical protein J14TS2_32070 [Bacillus sp. J14TS2]|nr:hypothetical protein J14TS2_32070 [Bacillus sp. J14TS2]